MKDKLAIVILFFIIECSIAIGGLQPKLLYLRNSEYLLVNENNIFRIENNTISSTKKISLEENSGNLNNIFKFNCLDESICVFINNYLYIFSSEGYFMKKLKIFDDNKITKYFAAPYYNNIKELNTFNYIILSVNSKGNFEIIFCKYDGYINKNIFVSKKETSLFYEKNVLNLKETDFTCNLISNSILCFFSNSKQLNNEINIIKFEVNFDNKNINIINIKKPTDNFILKGNPINSIINLNNSKINLFYSIKDENDKKINKVIRYNIKENKFEFIKEKNESIIDYIGYSKLLSDSKANMDYLESKDKYILYFINTRNKLIILELNNFFQIDSQRTITLGNNFKNYTFDSNKNINNNKSNAFFSKLLKNNREIKMRYLQENPGNEQNGNANQGSGDNPNGNNGNSNNDNNNQQGDNSNEDNNNNPIEGDKSGSQNNAEGNNQVNPENQNNNQGGLNNNSNSEGANPGGQGEGGNQGHEPERRGQTSGGFYFDFDNKNTTMPRDQIRDNRDSIMQNIEPGESYELKGDDYSIRVAPMGQRQDGGTSIDFRDCENKLREYYNLSSTSVLNVFQTEVTSSNNRSLTNKLQYVVYDENNTQLNLSICEDQKIQINFAIKENSSFSLERFTHFEDKGIDILNSSDPFFNDICYSYSDGDSDMVLKDRISDIFQNYSLCDSGCEYEGLNSTSGTVSCSCSVNTDDSDTDDDNSSENIKQIFLSLFSDSTFGVIQCYNLVFNKSKKSNIGFWVFLVIIIGHIPLYVWFFMKGNSQIKDYINKEMEKYHYLDEPKEKIEENNKNNPPKKTNPISDKNSNNKSRNVESDLAQKKENLNLIKNTAETEGNEISNNDKLNIDYSPRDKINMVINAEQTSNSNSKGGLNENIITVYKTEENIVQNEKNLKQKEKGANSSYFLIHIDANNSPDNDKPIESNYILDNYEFETAIKFESRSFWRILYIVLIAKDNILNTFILRSPLQSKPLSICLLLFSYISDLALNTLFYFSDNISDKYHYTGKYLFWYTLFNNLLISVISTVLSLILGAILNLFADSKDGIEEEFKEEEKKLREDSNYKVSEERKKEILNKINKELYKLKIKMTIFVVIDFIILLLFFYFVTAFCEVYKNTQTSWISDAIVSIIISFPIELAIALVITIIYFLSIKYKWKYVYKLAMFLI